jgi:hypothetical protein
MSPEEEKEKNVLHILACTHARAGTVETHDTGSGGEGVRWRETLAVV